MQIVINCNLLMRDAGYIGPELMDALVRLYLSTVHQVHELDMRLISISTEYTLSEICDAAVPGTCCPNVESIQFDSATKPSESHLPNGEIYRALAVVYAWLEYCWDDIDIDDAKMYFENDDPIETFIQRLTEKYDISSVDPYTKQNASCGLFRNVTEIAIH